jgi:hypothetical protein
VNLTMYSRTITGPDVRKKKEDFENVNLCSELTRLVALDVLSPLVVVKGWLFIKCDIIIAAKIM